jgi:thymidylate synthase ThyX
MPLGKTSAKVILDSINSQGSRIVTVEIEYPLFIQAQLNTHKSISKNSASQRAIPSKRWLNEVPVFVPNVVAVHQRGMGESVYLEGEDLEIFREQWLEWERLNVEMHQKLQAFWKDRLGKTLSKGVMNRPIGAFRYTRTVLTGIYDNKGWRNFERLRRAHDAQSEHQILATAIMDAIESSEPVERAWHLPYAPEDLPLQRRITWSCSQCARVSYRRENDDNPDKDMSIFKKLSGDGHWSTFEHQGYDYLGDEAIRDLLYSLGVGIPLVEVEGNFFDSGWLQLRKLYDFHTRPGGDEAGRFFKSLWQWFESELEE